MCNISDDYQYFNLLLIVLHHDIDYCDASIVRCIVAPVATVRSL